MRDYGTGERHARAQEFRDLADQIMFKLTKQEFLRLAKEYERRAPQGAQAHASNGSGDR